MDSVTRKWCVVNDAHGGSVDLRLSADVDSRDEAEVLAGKWVHGVVAEVVYDTREWEPVGKQRPITAADAGRDVKLWGCPIGLLETLDDDGLTVCVRTPGGQSVRFWRRDITHVAIPQKTRKAISWTHGGEWDDAIIGHRNGDDVAIIRAVIEDDAGELVPRFRAAIRGESRVFEKASAARAWCEMVLNGDEE